MAPGRRILKLTWFYWGIAGDPELVSGYTGDWEDPCPSSPCLSSQSPCRCQRRSGE